jgi:3-hydroxyisobutyrate dehydrogenase-like beta-hydroxyacid dehydrogenase
MMSPHSLPQIGFVGLGDQGGPIAYAIADAGYNLHVWARRPQSLDALQGASYVVHDSLVELAATVDIVGLCLSQDQDNRRVLLDGGLLAGLRPGSIVVNHGTGLPAEAKAIAAIAAGHGVHFVDAPVSGGHDGAVAKQLTTIVGADLGVFERCRPVFEAFSKLVVHLGAAGTGQIGKLVNNTMLMANQKNISDLLGNAQSLGVDLPGLVSVLRSGTASSTAMQVLGSAVRPDNAEHLRRLQLIDMDLFTAAVKGMPNVQTIVERAVQGADALPSLAALVTE